MKYHFNNQCSLPRFHSEDSVERRELSLLHTLQRGSVRAARLVRSAWIYSAGEKLCPADRATDLLEASIAADGSQTIEVKASHLSLISHPEEITRPEAAGQYS
jgi:hypothetical protein